MAAKLTQPAASVEEFESRCSALADLLGSLNLPSQAGTLQNMKAKLGGLLGERAGRAQAAVDTVRWVVALRAGQQHQGADVRAEQAKVAGWPRSSASGVAPGTICVSSPRRRSTPFAKRLAA
jgi:hypothetical protein